MGLFERIEDGSAVLGVVGLGYVGLPLAVEMAKAGHRVVGLDVSAEKVALVNAGTSYIPDVPTEELAELVTKGLIRRHRFRRRRWDRRDSDLRPHAARRDEGTDTSYMEKAAAAVTPYLHPGMLITLESTTTRARPRRSSADLEASGLTVGGRRSTSRSRPSGSTRNPTFQTRNTPKSWAA